MFRLSLAIAVTAVVVLAVQSQSDSRSMPRPVVPYYDWNACPGEGCTYGEWTARKPVVLYDTWKQNRRLVTTLSAGAKVTGVSGLVITWKPGLIRMDRDLAEKDLKRGDTILTYAYRGEGVSAVWLKGRYYPNFDISFTKYPDGAGCQGESCRATDIDSGKKSWWAEVKSETALMGWTDMDRAEFDGVCGGYQR